jgi:CheY-like chemotaxis protein
LTFSRPAQQTHEIIAVQPVVYETLQLIRATLPAMIDVRARFALELPAIAADPTQVQQALVNLATNAAYAIGNRPGHIRVEAELADMSEARLPAAPELRPGRYVAIAVHDDGCGMDSATLARAFDPFFTTKPQGMGTGLGLSVVHGIMRSHFGAVTAESEPGHGTTIRLLFPVAEGKVAATQAPAATAADAAALAGHDVLFVDDEEPLVHLMTRVLTRKGYRVNAFVDPAEALAAFREEPARYDVAVCDLAMPRMTGFVLAEQLLATRPDLPIVLASGYVRDDEEAMAKSMGIREVIEKPATIDAFAEILDRLLRKRAQSSPVRST